MFGVVAIAREPSWVLIIRQWVPPKEIVIANSMANFSWGIGVVGLMLVPVLLRLLNDSWRYTTYVLGIVMPVFALGWQVFGRERQSFEHEEQTGSKNINPKKIC